MSDEGLQKAAVLMFALGEDAAAQVMKFLEPREVQKLGLLMSTMTSVSTDSLSGVLNELRSEASKNKTFNVDSQDYISGVLNKALGDDKASNLLNRILTKSDSTGIDNLKWMDAKAVANLIYNEHPQIIATILLHLPALQASEILTEFTERTRIDVLLRITTLDGIQPLILNDLNEVLTNLLTGNDSLRKKPLGGIKAAASIMNFLNTDIESVAMSKIKDFDESIAEQINEEMFVFDNIVDIADRDIQAILLEIPSEGLIIALKGAKEEIKNKILKNMSGRAAEMMLEDLNSKGPVRLSEVEKQQKEILIIIRRLADEGQITISSGGEDDFV